MCQNCKAGLLYLPIWGNYYIENLPWIQTSFEHIQKLPFQCLSSLYAEQEFKRIDMLGNICLAEFQPKLVKGQKTQSDQFAL